MEDLEQVEKEEQVVSENEETESKEEGKGSKFFKELIIYALIFVFIVVITPRYIWAKAVVDGSSMETTLHNEDILIQEKVSYYFKQPSRYDVVILKHHALHIEDEIEEDEDSYWVKRIIGLPGETIQIKEDGIYINNEKLEDENYGNAEIDYYGIAEEPYEIPEGEYFVMGDNRIDIESYDSRYEEIGTIKRDDIIGRVLLRVYPFASFRIIQ